MCHLKYSLGTMAPAVPTSTTRRRRRHWKHNISDLAVWMHEVQTGNAAYESYCWWSTALKATEERTTGSTDQAEQNVDEGRSRAGVTKGTDELWQTHSDLEEGFFTFGLFRRWAGLRHAQHVHTCRANARAWRQTHRYRQTHTYRCTHIYACTHTHTYIYTTPPHTAETHN